MSSRAPQFDFGKNWEQFSNNALTTQRLEQARREFLKLTDGLPLNNSFFLDIGFGQGLSLLAAASSGARAVGCDINPTCAAVLDSNTKHYPELTRTPDVVVGSILLPETIERLRALGREDGTYDVVHSWGVLHHTGNLKKSIRIACSLVAPSGYFVVALYNRHWSSRAWLLIKWFYVKSPFWLRRLMITIFYPIIFFAKWCVTFKSPMRQERGMDFYYNVIDWVGGYPYEYASVEDVIEDLRAEGFGIRTVTKAIVPTGCNEFVFQRAK